MSLHFFWKALDICNKTCYHKITSKKIEYAFQVTKGDHTPKIKRQSCDFRSNKTLLEQGGATATRLLDPDAAQTAANKIRRAERRSNPMKGTQRPRTLTGGFRTG